MPFRGRLHCSSTPQKAESPRFTPKYVGGARIERDRGADREMVGSAAFLVLLVLCAWLYAVAFASQRQLDPAADSVSVVEVER